MMFYADSEKRTYELVKHATKNRQKKKKKGTNSIYERIALPKKSWWHLRPIRCDGLMM